MTFEDAEPLYSKGTAAAKLGVSERTLDRLRREGRISFRQAVARGPVWFSQRDLDEFAEREHRALVAAHPPVQPSPARPPMALPALGRKRPSVDLSGRPTNPAS